jgi:glycosyltransferase involved in cell wall biosynthesis
MDLTVLYCSKHGLEGDLDREFGVKVKWDIPVLEGYCSVFLKNYAPKPGIYGFAGLLNLGLIPYLFKAPKSVFVVHGWGYLINLVALIAGKLAGHTVCLRGETPACHEQKRSARSLRLRQLFLGKMLFRFADYFLYIGQENKAFYQLYGATEKQLLFSPYSVDNERFSKSARLLLPRKNELRKALGLPLDKTIVLFSGKYIDKKRPLDLLQAFYQSAHRRNACLVFMGEGELRPQMERFVEEKKLENVFLTGFVNQSKVAEYYAAADIFTMCSQEGETWGLSTNEAMNFRLPILISDMTGSFADLVKPGKNGYVFKTGDVEDYAEKLDLLLSQPTGQLAAMGAFSEKIISKYDFDHIIESLRNTQPRKTIKPENLRTAKTQPA